MFSDLLLFDDKNVMSFGGGNIFQSREQQKPKKNLWNNHGRKANLIATLGNKENTEDEPAGLVLSGHTDTVPFDAGGWNSDPLKLTERDGKLYGLGSTDMKGFFAVALEAASAFDPAKFKAPLYLLATADEESTMNGARSLSRAQLPFAKAAIVGEPTDLRSTYVRASKCEPPHLNN